MIIPDTYECIRCKKLEATYEETVITGQVNPPQTILIGLNRHPVICEDCYDAELWDHLNWKGKIRMVPYRIKKAYFQFLRKQWIFNL